MSSLFRTSALALALFGMLAAPVAFARPPEQNAAYSGVRSGEMRSLPEIKNKVLPRMGGAAFVGSDFDSQSATYTLKFRRGIEVIWVDVDARTGAILRRSGD